MLGIMPITSVPRLPSGSRQVYPARRYGLSGVVKKFELHEIIGKFHIRKPDFCFSRTVERSGEIIRPMLLQAGFRSVGVQERLLLVQGNGLSMSLLLLYTWGASISYLPGPSHFLPSP